MDPKISKTIVFILAAGQSKRFGVCKQVSIINGRPMIHWVIDAVSELNLETFVVTGANADQLKSSLTKYKSLHICLNNNYKLGISSSIILAAQKALSLKSNLLLTFADIPFVTASDYQKIMTAGERGETIFSNFTNTIGPPVFFINKDLKHLLDLKGDQGAKIKFLSAKSINIENAARDIDYKTNFFN